MHKIKAEHLSKETFAPFGIFFDLQKDSEYVRADKGNGWQGGYTRGTLIDRNGSLGITESEDAVPFVVAEMEKHLHTQEAMMCLTDSIVFLVAAESEEGPDERKLKAFILNPGEVAVVNRGVWHSPAHGIDGPVKYYWMAEAYDGDPTFWEKIKDGPVEVQI